MQTLLLNEATQENIELCSKIISQGKLCIFPTETVYGLGANALDEKAVSNIYKAKGRPSDNPLIVHLSNPMDAEKYAYTNELYYKLADRFMPGPLTVILPKKDIVPDIVSCGLKTVAIRIPSNKIAHELIEKSGCPIAAPSANLSGSPSPTSYEHVCDDMNGRVDAILNGGECSVGVESTVIRIKDNGVEILRPGDVTYEELLEVVPDVTINNAVKSNCAEKNPASPGMKYKHYAPNSPVLLVSGNDSDVISFFIQKQSQENCGILCFDEDANHLSPHNMLTFGSKQDDKAQAHELFAKLRLFNKMNVEKIYARIPSEKGVGLAVYNRLIRAAGFEIINANNNQEQ